MRGNRFNDYREITARFAANATCGHAVKKGDRIGWNRAYGAAQSRSVCADCWQRWVAENREAEMVEMGYMPNCY